MTGEELKEAFLRGVPVQFTVDTMPNTIMRAESIDAIIYRRIHGKLTVSAELRDGNGRTIYIVPSRRIKE